MNQSEVFPFRRRHRALSVLLHVCCILVLMATAVLVRTSSLSFSGDDEKAKEAYLSDNGIPYLTDMDSYYHVRLVRNYLDHGSLGDTVGEDGKPWDRHSLYPEGRSASYQPGIVLLTAGIHRLTGIELEVLEYKLSAYMTVLSVLAAYLIGWRICGMLSGLTAGLLIACAPVYAARTCFGRFDTDMFVISLELLFILFLTEALRSSTRRTRILLSLCFGLTAAMFSLCWTPRNTLLFGGLTLTGGMLYTMFLFFMGRDGACQKSVRGFFRQEKVLTVFFCGILTLFALLITTGFSAFSGVLSIIGFITDTTSVSTGEGVLPNLSASISELNRAKIAPESFLHLFLGYVPGAQPTVINGTGGLIAFVLGLAGLAHLFSAAFLRSRLHKKEASAPVYALYFFILGIWVIGTLLITVYGVRFIEHLSVPLSLLAGYAVGSLKLRSIQPKDGRRLLFSEQTLKLLISRAIPFLLCVGAVLPAAIGTVQSVSASRPSVTDASCYAMRYIRENARDPEAVIASWWDLGYYYESEADHPALWDGATQGGKRGILISKALTSGNPELSRRILLMLSASGNSALELLLSHTDAKTAYETLWEALLLEPEAAIELFQWRSSLPADEAREAESLIHPAQPKETYLVLTYSMTQQIAWYEYYANWNFTGNQRPPIVTVYSYTPDGQPLFDAEAGEAYLERVRGNELIWQLFFNARRTSCFSPVFEHHDGLEHVRVWRVEP